MNPSIDFIGDIHGHCSELRLLLKKLGYEETQGAFRYPGGERTVVFLGDYIDRGNEACDTVNLVRAMRDAGSAVALMGNHEFNALCFWQLNGAGGSHVIHCIRGGYLREHSFNKVAIHAKTVESYKGRKAEFEEMLDFFKTLPFYIEAETFRAQHACFDAGAAAKLAGENVHLKGPEMDLPEGITFRDGEGVLRKRARVKWWIDPKGTTMRELSFQPGVELPACDVPAEVLGRSFYGEKERPVFFGHYWLTGLPRLIRDNVCCLDFSVAGYRGDGRLVAYRFDGEQKLDESKFVWVEAI